MDFVPLDPYVPVGLQVGLRFSWWAPVSLIDGTVATVLSDLSPALGLTAIDLGPGGEASQDWDAKWQYSLEYDGVNDYMGATDDPELRVADGADVTFSAWVKFTGAVVAGSVYPILSKMTGTTTGEYMLYLLGSSNGTLRAGFRFVDSDGYYRQIVHSAVIPANSWVCLVGVYVGGARSAGLYIGSSGQFSTVRTAGTRATTADFEIGSCSAIARFFPGKIDEVTRWNRTLTTNESQLVQTTDLWEATIPVSRAASGDPLSYPVAETDVPTTPTDLEAVIDGSNEVDLAWFNPTLGVGMVEIYRSVDGGTSELLTRLSSTESSYHDSGADTSVSTYAYKIKATNQNGESAFTAEVSTSAGVTTDEGTITTDDGTLTTDES